jgi:hypothetical protein
MERMARFAEEFDITSAKWGDKSATVELDELLVFHADMARLKNAAKALFRFLSRPFR